VLKDKEIKVLKDQVFNLKINGEGSLIQNKALENELKRYHNKQLTHESVKA